MVAYGTTHQCFQVKGLTLEVGMYMERLDFYIAPIVHDMILGKPWLANREPEIDWQTNQISFVTPDGLEHHWTATYQPLAEDSRALNEIMSVKQLEQLLKKEKPGSDETMFYLCLMTNADLEEFHQAVDAAMEGKPEYLR